MIKLKLRPSNERSAVSLPAAIEIAYSASIIDIKQKLKNEANIPVEEQKLIYKGKLLQNEKTLDYYGIKDEDIIVFLRSNSRGQQSSPSVSSASSTTNNPQNTQRSRFMPSGFPAGVDQMMNDPEAMRNILNNPFMQSLLNNPEFLRSMFRSNPELQAILEAQPQLNHVLNDPQLLRQQLEAMTNPALRDEMMRNNDRALSNIESIPGGYNTLRRMYHDIQEPMMNAADAATRLHDDIEDDDVEEPMDTSSTPNNAPVPNPWSSNRNANTSNSNSNGSMPSSMFNLPDLFSNTPLFANQGNLQGNFASGSSGRGPGESSSSSRPPNPWAARTEQVEVQSESTNASNSSADVNSRNNATFPFETNTNMMDSIIQLMQQPHVQEVVQRSLSNPSFVENMVRNNPMLNQMMNSNPVLQQTFSNPQFLQDMFNPQTLAAMQQLRSQGNDQAQGDRPNGANLASLEVRFSRQLAQLEQMGFPDRNANVQALARSNGSIDGAIDHLINSTNSGTA